MMENLDYLSPTTSHFGESRHVHFRKIFLQKKNQIFPLIINCTIDYHFASFNLILLIVYRVLTALFHFVGILFRIFFIMNPTDSRLFNLFFYFFHLPSFRLSCWILFRKILRFLERLDFHFFFLGPVRLH